MSGKIKIIRIKANPAPAVRVRKRRTVKKRRTRTKTRRLPPARGYVVELVMLDATASGKKARGRVAFAWWNGLKFATDRGKAERFSTTARALFVARRAMKKAKSDWYAARVVPA